MGTPDSQMKCKIETVEAEERRSAETNGGSLGRVSTTVLSAVSAEGNYWVRAHFPSRARTNIKRYRHPRKTCNFLGIVCTNGAPRHTPRPGKGRAERATGEWADAGVSCARFLRARRSARKRLSAHPDEVGAKKSFPVSGATKKQGAATEVNGCTAMSHCSRAPTAPLPSLAGVRPPNKDRGGSPRLKNDVTHSRMTLLP